MSVKSGAISWSSKKRPIVTLSSTKGKYRGKLMAISEAVWLKRNLKELFISINDPILIYYDNLINIHLAPNSVFHAQTKHIELHYQFSQECVLLRDVDLQHISTNLQTTDMFTKPLGPTNFGIFLWRLDF